MSISGGGAVLSIVSPLQTVGRIPAVFAGVAMFVGMSAAMLFFGVATCAVRYQRAAIRKKQTETLMWMFRAWALFLAALLFSGFSLVAFATALLTGSMRTPAKTCGVTPSSFASTTIRSTALARMPKCPDLRRPERT